MQIVLSELDNLSILNRLGVYPDLYYLDFNEFKSYITVASEADIIIILSGTCRFNKKHTVDLIKTLVSRAESQDDSGVVRVTVFSDSYLDLLDLYYKYEHDLASIIKYKRLRAVDDTIDIWSTLKSVPKVSQIVYDTGTSKTLMKKNPKDDELLPLIKKPIVRGMV